MKYSYENNFHIIKSVFIFVLIVRFYLEIPLHITAIKDKNAVFFEHSVFNQSLESGVLDSEDSPKTSLE